MTNDPRPAASLSIAVLGAGKIGSAIGDAAAAAGHAVTLGTRTSAEAAAGPAPAAGTPRRTSMADAVAASDIVVIAIPGAAVAPLVQDHADALAGKLIVDAANSIGPGSPVAHHHEAIRAAVPTARYARAFNTLGVENLLQPRFGNEVADLFYSAPVDDRDVMAALIEAVGLRPVYVGTDAEDIVDGLLRLWFALAVGQGLGRHLALRLLT